QTIKLAGFIGRPPPELYRSEPQHDHEHNEKSHAKKPSLEQYLKKIVVCVIYVNVSNRGSISNRVAWLFKRHIHWNKSAYACAERQEGRRRISRVTRERYPRVRKWLNCESVNNSVECKLNDQHDRQECCPEQQLTGSCAGRIAAFRRRHCKNSSDC